MPVYALACLVTCIVGFSADRYGQRGYFNMCVAPLSDSSTTGLPYVLYRVFCTIGAVGYIILIASRNATLSYVGVFIAACGIFPTIANTLAWLSNNLEGSYKRSVTLALAIGVGTLNGAVSSNVVSLLLIRKIEEHSYTVPSIVQRINLGTLSVIVSC